MTLDNRSQKISSATQKTTSNLPFEILEFNEDGSIHLLFDETHERALFRRGNLTAVIYYDKEDMKSCKGKITKFHPNSQKDQYIYCRGCVVAGYDPLFDDIFYLHDDDLYYINHCKTPIGYTIKPTIDICLEMMSKIVSENS